jgi:hypothetical protein
MYRKKFLLVYVSILSLEYSVVLSSLEVEKETSLKHFKVEINNNKATNSFISLFSDGKLQPNFVHRKIGLLLRD